MDLGDLLILLLFLFPILSRLFGKKKPTPQRTRPLPGPDGERGTQQPHVDDPLADALRQIREALGEEEPEPERPSAAPQPLPKAPRPLAKKPTRPGEFHEIGAYEHEEHGFGRSNPISEEVFEQQPALRGKSGTDRIKQRPLGSVDLTTPIEVKKVAAATPRTTMADVLRDPKRAREAFVMKEVLGPPRSRRR